MPRPPVPPIVRRPLIGRQGPWRGVRDTLEPTASDPSLALMMRNVLPLAPDQGSIVVGRPGFRAAGAPGGRVQWLGQFTKTDGTELTLKIAGGEIYAYDWSADEWTLKVSRDDLSNAGISLSATARVRAVEFADQLIVSDGLVQPFAWDGTQGGGLTLLTNAPVFYGQPTVYYGRLFAIKAAERSTIVWCEPGQPNTGYEAGGFNNAWTLRQTDQSPLYALMGTNTALYYWRARSIGAVLGAVDAEFRTSGTHEGVSTRIGTISPDAVVVAEDSIWFLDSDGHPQRLVIGGALQEPAPWLDARRTLEGQDLSYLPDAEAVYRPDLRSVLFLVRSPRSQVRDRLLRFHAPTGQFTGYDDYATAPPTRIGVVKDASTLPREQQVGTGSVTQADALRTQNGDCDTSTPIQVRITYSTADAQPGDTVTIEQSVSGAGYVPVAIGLPPGAAKTYTISIPGREYNVAGTPEQRRYRVRLLDANGNEKGSMESGVVDTSYVACGAPGPGGPVVLNAQASRTANGDCTTSTPMRVRVAYLTDNTDPGDTVTVDVAVNGGDYVQLASGLPVGNGSVDDVIAGREFDASGTSEQRRYRIRIIRSGMEVARAETGIVATSYRLCGPAAPQVTLAQAQRVADGACDPPGSPFFPFSGIQVQVSYTTDGTGTGHSVAIDESVDGGAYAEIASGLATGSGLGWFVFLPPGRVYDASGTPETRKYRVRIVDENGDTVASAETGAVDTSYVLCPALAGASASRIDGICDVPKAIAEPMRVIVSYTVSASAPGDTVEIDRAIDGGSYSTVVSFADIGPGFWVDEMTGTYYDPTGTPQTRTYRVRIVRGGQTIASAETPAVDTSYSQCHIPAE